ncbi:MAG: hypothetical protein IJ740_02145 [Ruminococcus sp.]|nr:hypothetical protein [Ruminococcus sp.]
MEAFKYAVLCASAVTVIGKIITFLCGSRYDNLLRLMTALVLILTVAKAISGAELDIDISDGPAKLEEYSSKTEKEYMSMVSDKISKKLTEIYKNKNINIRKIGIACSYDEYNFITVDRITIYPTSKEDKNDLESVAREYFPDADIIIDS